MTKKWKFFHSYLSLQCTKSNAGQESCWKMNCSENEDVNHQATSNAAKVQSQTVVSKALTKKHQIHGQRVSSQLGCLEQGQEVGP